MAREWVKLRTSILGHAGTMMLDAEAFRLWIVLLAMAGLADDDGRAGTVEEIAFNLHRSYGEVDVLLAFLNGRAEERDGQVYVRDWAEHQPLMDTTNADRQARYRQRHSNDRYVTRDVTTVTNGATRARDTSNRREPSIHTEQKLTSGADAPHAQDANSDRWEPFYEDCAALWGMTPRTGKDGVRAFVGQMTRMAATATGEDVAESRRLLRKWSESPDFAFAHTPGLAPPKFGKWLQSQTCYSGAVER